MIEALKAYQRELFILARSYRRTSSEALEELSQVHWSITVLPRNAGLQKGGKRDVWGPSFGRRRLNKRLSIIGDGRGCVSLLTCDISDCWPPLNGTVFSFMLVLLWFLCSRGKPISRLLIDFVRYNCLHYSSMTFL